MTKVRDVYLNTIEQLFLFVEQLDHLEVCLTYSRLLTEISIPAVFQNIRWYSNKTSLHKRRTLLFIVMFDWHVIDCRSGLIPIWGGILQSTIMSKTSEFLLQTFGNQTYWCTTGTRNINSSQILKKIILGHFYFSIFFNFLFHKAPLYLNWQILNIEVFWIIIKINFSASEAFDSTYPTNVVVTSEGTCTYIPPGWFVWKLKLI